MAGNLSESLELPEGVKGSMEKSTLTLEGPKGKVSIDFQAESVTVNVKDSRVEVNASRKSKRERQKVGTFRAQVMNMITGVVDGHRKTMKICSGHFPMTVTVNGNEFIVKNFVGEKTPRKLTIPDGVTVKVSGTEVEIESTDKQLAGNVTSAIEHLTKRTKFDRRIFQDGIITIRA